MHSTEVGCCHTGTGIDAVDLSVDLLGEHEQGRDLIVLNSHAQNLGDGEIELDIPALSFLASSMHSPRRSIRHLDAAAIKRSVGKSTSGLS